MWFDKAVKQRCKGEAYIIRYADDFVCFFQYENEAQQFYRDLKARLAKFGLELADDKSKIMRFGRFAKQNSKDGKTDTFDFLGFTFINGKTLTGKYRIIYRTSRKKLTAKKQAVKEWLIENLHNKPSDTITLLNKKLVGHYRYYGISGNYQSLLNFYKFAVTAFYKALTRRSQRAYLTKPRFYSLLNLHPIVKPKIYASVW